MKAPILYTPAGTPIYRIAGGSQGAEDAELSIQDQVAAAVESSRNNEAPAETEGTDTKQEGLSGYAKDFLGSIPEEDRPIVQRHLSTWDKNVQKKFQENQDLQSQYEPWQEFTQEGYTPEYLKQTVQFAKLLNENPQHVYEILAQQLGIQDQGVEEEVEDDSPDENTSQEAMPAWAVQQQKALEVLAGRYVAQVEESQKAQDSQELDNYMSALHEAHGDFDDEYVLSAIGQGMDGNKAVERFNNIIESQVAKRRSANDNAPQLIGGGGGMPSSDVDPSAMSTKEVREYIAQMAINSRKE